MGCFQGEIFLLIVGQTCASANGIANTEDEYPLGSLFPNEKDRGVIPGQMQRLSTHDGCKDELRRAVEQWQSAWSRSDGPGATKAMAGSALQVE